MKINYRKYKVLFEYNGRYSTIIYKGICPYHVRLRFYKIHDKKLFDIHSIRRMRKEK